MTDLPRRSYPLVVAPPGGFEDAVRRGRRMRRRRTSGTSGAALVLVGALGYSLLGHGSGVDRLDPTDTPPIDHTQPAPGVAASAGPSATPTTAPGRTGTTVAAGPRGGVPTAGPTSITTHPTRRPGNTTRRYAVRPVIKQDQESTNTNPDCIAGQASGEWCTFANVDTSQAVDGTYTLEYYVCRPAALSQGVLTFNRKQRVDFAAVEDAHDDTVWTYSAGQNVLPDDAEVRIDAGYCVRWWTSWNGYDDFGYTPNAGQYTLAASSFASGPPIATWSFTHE